MKLMKKKSKNEKLDENHVKKKFENLNQKHVMKKFENYTLGKNLKILTKIECNLSAFKTSIN